MYDYLIVGAGLSGSIAAHELKKAGKKVIVVEKRNHVGGNLYCESIDDVTVHKYGAHIFHTSNEYIWNYMNSFVEFNDFINSPVAKYKDEVYNLPFNMNTFSQLWGISTPEEAKAKIEEQKYTGEVTNLEEQALSLVGQDVYEKLVKEYTEKQWGRECKDLPASIIKRLPVRFTYNNNYFNDTYQGIPIDGWNKLFDWLLEDISVQLNTDFFEHREDLEKVANKIIYTGPIDQYFDYSLGKLEYRTVTFENETFDTDNYQGVAVVNYTSSDVPYTRSIEHRFFDSNCTSEKTVVSKEYPAEYTDGMEPFYPINDEANTALYNQYKELADKEENTVFLGRLAEYKYYDMAPTVANALTCALECLK